MKKNPFKKYEKINVSSFFIKGKKKRSRVSIRLDPLFGEYSPYSTSISSDRAKKPDVIKYVKKEPKKEGCIFCEPKIYEVTPEPKIDHSKEGLFTPEGRPVISVPNLFPFSPNHYVTIFTDHKVDIIDWVKEDMVNYIETSFYFSKKFKREKAEGMWDIVNHGVAAGASQPHPHAQRGTLEKRLNFTIALEQEALTRKAEELGEDPFEVYMSKVRDSRYFIFENDFLFICAPFAPKSPDQVDIISKQCFNTLLDTPVDYREGWAESMIGVLHSLGKDRGVSDINIALHQSFFGVNDYYRLHWHIFPRNKSRVGGLELNNSYVVGIFPRVTAKALRKHFGVSGYD